MTATTDRTADLRLPFERPNILEIAPLYDVLRREAPVAAVTTPAGDPAWNEIDEIDKVPGDLKDEIAHFFAVYTDLEGEEVVIDGWGSSDEAHELIEECRRRYEEE